MSTLTATLVIIWNSISYVSLNDVPVNAYEYEHFSIV